MTSRKQKKSRRDSLRSQQTRDHGSKRRLLFESLEDRRLLTTPPVVTAPDPDRPAPAVNAVSYTIEGRAESNSLVTLYSDNDHSHDLTEGDTSVDTRTLGADDLIFRFPVTLTQNAENDFLLTETVDATVSEAVPVPTITETNVPIITTLTRVPPEAPATITSYIIAGAGDVGSTVKLYDSDGTTVLKTATVIASGRPDGLGTFAFAAQDLVHGVLNNFFVAETEDEDEDATFSPSIPVPTLTDVPIVDDPAGATAVTGAIDTTYTITGTAFPGSVVKVYKDMNNDGVIDPLDGDEVVASQNLSAVSAQYTSFAIAAQLWTTGANNFVVLATDGVGASDPTNVPTITLSPDVPPADMFLGVTSLIGGAYQLTLSDNNDENNTIGIVQAGDHITITLAAGDTFGEAGSTSDGDVFADSEDHNVLLSYVLNVATITFASQKYLDINVNGGGGNDSITFATDETLGMLRPRKVIINGGDTGTDQVRLAVGTTFATIAGALTVGDDANNAETITLNGNVTTGGSMDFANAVALAASATLTGTTGWFSSSAPVTGGAHGLITNFSSSVQFGAAVSGLASLEIQGTGSATFDSTLGVTGALTQAANGMAIFSGGVTVGSANFHGSADFPAAPTALTSSGSVVFGGGVSDTLTIENGKLTVTAAGQLVDVKAATTATLGGNLQIEAQTITMENDVTTNGGAVVLASTYAGVANATLITLANGKTINTTAPFTSGFAVAASGAVTISAAANDDGNGAIDLTGSSIVTTGAANTDAPGVGGIGNGGVGGNVSISTTSTGAKGGAIALGNVTTSGGNATNGGTGGNAGTITITSVGAGNGVTLYGALTASAATIGAGSTGNRVTVTSAANIVDGAVAATPDILAPDAVLTAVTGIGASGAVLEINVTNLDVNNMSSGGAYITDTAGGLVLRDVDVSGSPMQISGVGQIMAKSPLTISGSVTHNASFTYTAGTNGAVAGDDLTINAGAVVTLSSATDGTLTFEAGDNIILGAGVLNSGTIVTSGSLDSGHSVLLDADKESGGGDGVYGSVTQAEDPSTTVSVATNNLTINADGGIGSGSQALLIDVDALTANSSGHNGDQYLTESSGLTALNLNAGSGSVTLVLTLGALQDADINPDITATTANVTLSAATKQDVGTLGSPINTSVNSLNVDTLTGKGDQYLKEVSGLTQLNLNAGATGNVTLTVTAGAVADTDGSADITGAIATVVLSDTAAGAGSFGASGAGSAINTSVDSLNVDSSASKGNQYITESSDLTQLSLNAGNTGVVTLVLTAGALGDADGLTDVTAGTANLTASSGIGDSNAIQTVVSTLSFANTTNAVQVTNTLSGGVTVSGTNGGVGAVSITETAGNLTVGSADIVTNSGVVNLTASFANKSIISASGSDIVTNNAGSGAAITLVADNMDLAGAITAGNGLVTLKPNANAVAIQVGATAADGSGVLGLLATELNLISTTGGVTVGSSSNTGGITVVGAANLTTAFVGGTVTLLSNSGTIAVDATLTTQSNGTLQTGGSIGFGASGAVTSASSTVTLSAGGSINGNSTPFTNVTGSALIAAASTGIGSADALETAVSTTSFSNSTSGDVNLSDVDGISASGSNTGAGNISVTAGGTNNVLTVNSSNVSTGSGTVSLTGDHMTITGTVTTTGMVTLGPNTSGTTIDLGGADASGTLGLTDTELNQIHAGTARVGSAAAGAIAISGTSVGPDNVTTAFSLITNAGVSETGTLAYAGGLRISAVGPVSLAGGNDIGSLAAALSGSTNAFTYNDTNGLIVDAVDGVYGVNTTNGAIAISTTDGNLTVSNVAGTDVGAGAGTIALTAGTATQNGLAKKLTINSGAKVVVTGATAGGITLTANNMDLSQSSSSSGLVDAGTRTVTLQPSLSGTLVKVGGTSADADSDPDTLGINNTELGNITAGTLNFPTGSGDFEIGGTIGTGTDTVIISTSGKIVDNNASNPDIWATNAILTTATGIGTGTDVSSPSNYLDTQVANLDVNNSGTSSGQVQIANTGALVVKDLDSSGSLTINGASAGAIRASSPLTISSSVTHNASFTYTAGSNGAAAGDNLTINAGAVVTLSSATDGTLTFEAGDNIILGTGALNSGTIVTSGSLDGGHSVLLDADKESGGLDGTYGSVTQDQDVTSPDTTVSVTTDNLTINGAGGIGTNSQPLLISVGTLTANSSGHNGDQYITESNGVQIVTVNAGSGDLTLTATIGGITDDTNDSVTDLTAHDAVLTAETGVGESGGHGSLDTAVNTLDVSVTGAGLINLNELNAVDLFDIDTFNGPITITTGGDTTATNVTSTTDLEANDISITASSGSITVGLVQIGAATDATAGDVSLQATNGSIVDNVSDALVDVVGDRVTLTAKSGVGEAVGLNGASLDTRAVSLDVSVTAAGLMNLNELNAVDLFDIDAFNGPIMITTAGATTATDVVSTTDNDANDISIAVSVGDLTVTTVNAGAVNGDVTLTANTVTGQKILDDESGLASTTVITGDVVTLTADGGVGTAGTNVDTTAKTLDVSVTAAGLIQLAETDGVNLLAIDTFNGPITITTGGDTTATNVTSTTDLDANDITITLSAGDLTVTTVNAGAVNGDVTLTANTVTGQEILDDESGLASTTVITGDVVTLTADGGVGTAGTNVDTTAKTLDVSVTAAGLIQLAETDGVNLLAIDTFNGPITITTGGDTTATNVTSTTDLEANDISITASSGSITVGLVQIGAATDATAGDVSLQATNGSIVDNVSDALVDVVGDRVTLTAKSGVGEAVGLNGASLDTRAVSLDVSVTAAGLMNLNELNAVDLFDIDAFNGPIMITTAGATTATDVVSTTDNDANDISIAVSVGDLTVTTVNAGAVNGDVTLTANTVTGQKILDDESGLASTTVITGDVVTLTADGGVGTAGTNVDTTAKTLDVSVTAAGLIQLAETDGVNLLAIDTFNGPITITTGGDTTATNVTSTTDLDANDITITLSAGDLTVTTVNAGAVNGDVTLTANTVTGQEILDDESGLASTTVITGDVVTLTADGGVGTAGTNVDTTAKTLDVSVTAAGLIQLAETDGVNLLAIDTFNGPITITTGGDTTATNVTSTTDLEANDISITASSGSITVGLVQIGAATDATAGDVSLQATNGSIVDNVSDALVDVVGDRVTLTAKSGVGEAVGLNGASLDTRAVSLDVSVTAAGLMNLNELNAVDLFDIDAFNGPIMITTAGATTATDVVSTTDNDANDISIAVSVGDLTVTTVNAGAVNGDVTLTANTVTGQEILDDESGLASTTVITGDVVTLTADGGVGTAGTNVDTTAKTLDVSVTAAGLIQLAETDGVNLLAIDTFNGPITITTGGDTTATNVTSTTDLEANDISITASSGSITVGLVQIGAATDATAGDVSLQATNGSIVDNVSDALVDVVGDRVTLTAKSGVGEAVGLNGASLDTRAVSLDVSVTAAGLMNLNELNAVDLFDIDAFNGPIMITTAGATTATDVVSTTDNDANDISIAVSVGDLTVTTVNAGAVNGDVTLTANTVTGQEILDDESGLASTTVITGDVVTLTADGGVGTAGTNVDTTAKTLDVSVTAAGLIQLAETDGVNLLAIDTFNGPITITTGGDTTATNVTSTTDLDANDITITLSAGDLTVTTVNAGAVNGDVTLTANTVTGQEILDDESGLASTTVITGDVVTLTADGGVGTAGTNVDTTAKTLDVSVTAAGLIQLAETDGVNLLAIDTFNGPITITTGGDTTATNVTSTTDLEANDISITASSGSITVGLVQIGAATDATAGDVSLQATNGSIVDNVSDALVDVVGDRVTLTAKSGVGEAVGLNGASLDTRAVSLDVSVTAAGLMNLNELNAVDLFDIDAFNGPIMITTAGATTATDVVSTTDNDANDISIAVSVGDLTVTTVNAGAVNGDVTLTANTVTGQKILDDESGLASTTVITGDVVTLTADGGVGTAGTNVDTTAKTLDVSVTAAGLIQLAETDGVNLLAIDTFNGPITITTGGDTTATNVTSTTDLDANDITITLSAGDLTVTTVNAGAVNGDVTLTANTVTGQEILDDESGLASTTVITGDVVTLTADGGVGTAGTNVDTTAKTLDVSVTAAGLIQLAETDGVNLLAIDTFNGPITITTGGDTTATNVTSTTDLDANDITITLSAGDLTVTTVNAGAVNGDITLTANTVTGQEILDDESGLASTTVITGDVVTLNADGGVGTAGTNVDTTAKTLDVSVTAAGLIQLAETDGVNLLAIDTFNGPITITAGGTITATDVSAGGSADVALTATGGGDILVNDVQATGDEVRLRASTGAIGESGADGTADITASRVALRAANGIGSGAAIETAVSTLAASNSTANNLELANDVGGLLTIGTVDSLVGVVNSGPSGTTVVITNAGRVLVDGQTAANGAVSVTASDSLSGGDDLTVNANVTSSNSTVTLRAGDNLTINASKTVSGNGQVTIQGDYNGVDGTRDTTITIIGDVTGGGAADSIKVLAGTGNDSIVIGASGGNVNNINSTITVVGNGGNDTLTLNDGGVTDGKKVSIAPISENTVASKSGLISNTAGAVAPALYFDSGVTLTYTGLEVVALNMGSGNDIIDMTAVYQTAGGVSTQFNIDAASPGAAPGDTLKFKFTNVAGPIVLAATASGSVYVGGFGTVTWASVETFSFVGLQESITAPNGSLYVQGTSGNDAVVFDESTGADLFTVKVGATAYPSAGTFTAISGALIAYGLNGTDNITVRTAGATANVCRFYGGAGDDYLAAAGGGDTLDGGAGNNTIYGYGGNDTILVTGSTASNQIDGGDGNDTITGGSGVDTIHGGAGNDFIRGGLGNDILYADSGNDILLGEDGNDTLYGATGLAGAANRCVLIGGNGADRLYAAAGDLMIANKTNYDSSNATLKSVMAEWASTVDSVTTRQTKIKAMGLATVAETTAAADYLYGSSAADWFWYSAEDRASGYLAGTDVVN